ncbi:MAG: aminodeoxychorismate synthase component I [Candidatus Endonucleobacter bathymodioli]|uniref:aminodeoxychorismate synthase n=1 Tax=Candidatus Endonucleibacter bathymodioli TaxID=539814 RepID=A0AA90NYQ5_9GAMM|nr:aminodeoxychorismate synthase component I [Candidatus Endonucleobacter bathymodioli]
MKISDLRELEYKKDSSEYFKHFKHMPLSTFLDSCADSQKGKHVRYDIISANPSDIISVAYDGTLIWQQCLKGVQSKSHQHPFEKLAKILGLMQPIDDDRFPFTGGLLGYWSYELGAVLEPELITAGKSIHNPPVMCIGLFWWALITDHQLKQTHIIFHPDIHSQTRLAVLSALDKPVSFEKKKFQLSKKFLPTISVSQYRTAFNRIQEYILSGDCYEVNLTQEFIAPYTGDSWEAYLHLRKVSPAPYSAFLAYPRMTILCHSPERFIQVNGRTVEANPIKGTIARGNTPEEDLANAKWLQSSQKDRSENLMIVDLLRNDLGKVCETGSVKVTSLFSLESYANVHHLASSITGRLPEKVDVFTLMSSVFPGGSITGAPKLRSMQIIRELEVSARSVYCGSIGYISCNNVMDTNIAIRTVVDYGEQLHCWGGGAIVADSTCEQEYEESVTKVKNLMNALNNHACCT